MPVNQPKLEAGKKYFTQKDFEDGKCDKDGNEVVPILNQQETETINEPQAEASQVEETPAEPETPAESETDPDPEPEKETE